MNVVGQSIHRADPACFSPTQNVGVHGQDAYRCSPDFSDTCFIPLKYVATLCYVIRSNLTRRPVIMRYFG